MNRPHERRLDRALYHLESFKAERRAWLEEDPHRFRTELDAERGKNVIWAQVITPPPDSLSLIAGDCIHNLRASLDNLAFELALAYTKGPLPNEAEADSGFPIFSSDPAESSKSWPLKKFNDMIRCIDPLAKAEIERLQPYKRRDGFRRDRLWQLNKLESIDKHRLPHTATLNNLSTLSYFEPSGIGIEEIETLFAFFDHSAPIAEYPAFDSTGAEVRVDLKGTFDICFSQGVPNQFLGKSIAGTLEGFYRHIVSTVRPVLIPFLSRH
jgi:hypothetical protein